MGRIPEWDEPHGWHEFQDGSWNGPDWCNICDCLRSDHVPREQYDEEDRKAYIAELQEGDKEANEPDPIIDFDRIAGILFNDYRAIPDAIHMDIDALQIIDPSMNDYVLKRDYDIIRGRDFVTLARDGIKRGVEP